MPKPIHFAFVPTDKEPLIGVRLIGREDRLMLAIARGWLPAAFGRYAEIILDRDRLLGTLKLGNHGVPLRMDDRMAMAVFPWLASMSCITGEVPPAMQSFPLRLVSARGELPIQFAIFQTLPTK